MSILRTQRSGRARDGQTLAVTLMILAFMTALLGSMSMGLMLESRMAAAGSERVAAYYIAKSGLEAATDRLLRDDQTFDAQGDGYRRSLEDLKEMPDLLDSKNRIDVVIVDEESRLNLNRADRGMLRALGGSVTEGAAKAIVARAVDSPFASVDEVATLPEVTPAIMREGLHGRVTVYGNGRVNVNTASAEVLRCMEMLSEEKVSSLLAHRMGEDGKPGTEDDAPFRTIGEVEEFLSMSEGEFARLEPWLSVSSSHFTITATSSLAWGQKAGSELREVVKRDRDGLVVLRFEQVR